MRIVLTTGFCENIKSITHGEKRVMSRLAGGGDTLFATGMQTKMPAMKETDNKKNNVISSNSCLRILATGQIKVFDHHTRKINA